MDFWEDWSVELSTMKVFAVAATALAFGATDASARQVRIVDGVPKNGGLTTGYERFTEELGKLTDGRYTGRFFGGSLFGYAEITPALKDGLADVGFSIIGFFRAEFPVTNLVADIATATMDPVVAAGAISDFVYNCTPCVQEFLGQNQIVMGFTGLGPYYLYTKPKIVTLADISAKRIRGFGPFGRWVDAMGGSAAVISANEAYTSVSQGVVAGNTHTLNTLVTLSMGEVVDYVLDVPIAVSAGNALFNTNRDLWRELSDEDKRNFLHAAAIGHATATVSYVKEEKEVGANLAKLGMEWVEPGPDLLAKSEQFRVDDIAEVARIHKGFGVQDVDQHVEAFLATVKKWEALVAGIDSTDVEAVAKLYHDEIYSKVDLAIFD